MRSKFHEKIRCARILLEKVYVKADEGSTESRKSFQTSRLTQSRGEGESRHPSATLDHCA